MVIPPAPPGNAAPRPANAPPRPRPADRPGDGRLTPPGCDRVGDFNPPPTDASLAPSRVPSLAHRASVEKTHRVSRLMTTHSM